MTVLDGVPEVVVVGGGVIGASAAYFLTRAGLSTTLLERDEIGSHASGAAAGMLAPLCESRGNRTFFELGVRSLGLFSVLCAELREWGGIDPQYVRSGILRVAATPGEADRLKDLAKQLTIGEVGWVTQSELKSIEPTVHPELLGGIWSPDEGHVYSPALTRAYAQAAAGLGARIHIGVEVLSLLRANGRITGVRTSAGDQPAGCVVVATGVWTRFCAGRLGGVIPVEPVRGQILSLASPVPVMRRIVWGEDVYLVPKLNGSVVVGATEERAGYDCRTTASGVAALLAAAPRYVPALAESAFITAWAGLRPDTPDHLPIIGADPENPGLILATGHYRNGVLLSPITGQLIVDLVRGEGSDPLAAALRPERLMSCGQPKHQEPNPCLD